MLQKKDKILATRFLKAICRIKGWNYHEKIEFEKNDEIRSFVSTYIFEEIYKNDFLHEKISYNRINFVVQNPLFKPAIKALLVLLELSETEEEFKERCFKVKGNLG